jgi:hypothetical protein
MEQIIPDGQRWSDRRLDVFVDRNLLQDFLGCSYRSTSPRHSPLFHREDIHHRCLLQDLDK